MKRKSKLVAISATLVALQMSAVAAQADQQPAKADAQEDSHLGQTVVTATRTDKDVDTAPGSISVVTKEDIEKRNISTIDEALNTTAGVVTSRGKGMMDQMSSITLRGLPGQSRTLILVDGIAMNNPYSGSIFSSGISPGSIEQIEVVKGASSSLFGGNAMSGVVNMITKMPTKREFMLNSGYGSKMDSNAPEMTRRVQASYGDSFKDKFRIFIHNDYQATNGYRADMMSAATAPGAGITGYIPTKNYTGGNAYIIGDRGKNGAWQNNLTIKTEYQFNAASKLRFTFMKSTGGYDYKDPQTYLRNASGNPYWIYSSSASASYLGGYGYTDQYIYNVGFDTEIAAAKLKINLGLMDQVDSWSVSANGTSPTTVAPTTGKLSSTPASAWNADVQATFPVMSWNLVTVGGAFRTGSSYSREYALSNWNNENTRGAITYQAKGSDRTYSIFVQDEIVLHDKVTLYGGFRQDWWETFEGYNTTEGYLSSKSASAFSPKGAIVFKPFEKTTVKISGGRAFRAPTVYDMYRSWTTSTGSTYYSNSNLKPETNTSWDASVSQGFWEGAKLTVTYYENYISDLIYSSQTAPKVYNKFNAGKAESKGVEMEAEQRFGKLARLFANYTYAATKIKENSANPSSVGKQMTDVPEHMFSFGSDLDYGPFGASFVGRYVGKRYSSDTNNDTARGVQGAYDPYFVGDVKLRYKITSWATASFAVNNIWDEKYYSSSLAPGRSCYGDLTFKF